MYYNPIHVLTNCDNIYGGRTTYIDNFYAGAGNIPDNKTIFKIIGGKGVFLKTYSQYDTIPYTTAVKKKNNYLLYNIYDLRDYLQDNPSFSIDDFMKIMNQSSQNDRIMLLSGDTTYKIRNPNRQIFTDSSYPILITYQLNDKINIAIENPNEKLEKYPIPSDVCYVYKQKDTYVMSVDVNQVEVKDVYYITTDVDENNVNNIKSIKINDFSKSLERYPTYRKILVTKLIDFINQNIKPSMFNFSEYFNKYTANK
ncbi:ss/dsDNA binding protein VP8 (Cop-L4R) [Mythimna separata entomopoxvirus 'L']|uniref:Ss/dsDNA binding protein VP8 (Cop-L4R) n=1 Tax=Mythimna separata entomopoxvirus 'L' TaxID=1293572 RepID=A0A916KQ28_9POXV|nr:ss/dsDNA binding protein VP8 (Cop-L4R) [Mythimna separata entomopoxvirus 'L']CCU56282.1 ss/dsDNA binding protein VP8 (Cop-L4R) [Mythimna separata entomopoxvirus 'L']